MTLQELLEEITQYTIPDAKVDYVRSIPGSVLERWRDAVHRAVHGHQPVKVWRPTDDDAR